MIGKKGIKYISRLHYESSCTAIHNPSKEVMIFDPAFVIMNTTGLRFEETQKLVRALLCTNEQNMKIFDKR